VRYISGLLPFFKRLNIHSVLAMAGVAGPLVLVLAEFAAASSSPNHDVVRDSISSLALTPRGWLQTIGFLAIGLLVEIYVAGLLFNIRGVRGFGFGIGLLVFLGFGLLMVGAFRTDPTGVPLTTEGNIHRIMALTVFWLFPMAVLLLAPSLRNDPYWKNIFIYTVVAGILAVVLVTGLLILRDEISWLGLYERILVANVIIWVEVTAIKLLRLSVRRGVESLSG